MNFFSMVILISLTPVVFASEDVAPAAPARKSLEATKASDSASRVKASSEDTKLSGSAEQSGKSLESNKPADSANSLEKPLESKELANPARFGKITLKDPLDEVSFWSQQLSEHALFLHLGIEDAALKKRGLEIHKKFENFRKGMNEKNLDQVLPLTRELRAYKMDVVKQLNAGKWIGWIFPSFAKHITKELDYFVDKLNNVPYSPEDEAHFWNHINSDHAAFESHLFDPYERDLSQQANDLSEKINQLPDSEEDMFIHLSLTAAEELDQFNKEGRKLSKANKLQSVIHPVLMDHVIREGERSKKILSELDKAGMSEDATDKDTEEDIADNDTE
ncbi:DUF2935 domain-containing protein [Candidatus Dependentiae bacterium]|nr:DUF2935 domain-containing protein [Candidatus Dependentiae bacterium]